VITIELKLLICCCLAVLKVLSGKETSELLGVEICDDRLRLTWLPSLQTYGNLFLFWNPFFWRSLPLWGSSTLDLIA